MNVMDRESANGYIKRRVPCTDFLETSEKGMYCCPFCGSGKGKHKTGALKYFEEENVCGCFAKCAPTGKQCKTYDVFDIYMKKYNVEYAEALQELAKICNITLLPYNRAGEREYPAPAPQKAQEAAQTAKPSEGKETDVDTENKPKTEDASVPDGDAVKAKADYEEYYKAVNGKVNDQFFYLRGQCAMQAKAFQRALDDFTEAVELNPDELTYRAELAVVNMRVGRNEEAVRVLDEAIAKDADYAELYRLKGLALLQQKKNKDARAAFNKAKELGDPQVDALIEKYFN